jgi:hypothetical protein
METKPILVYYITGVLYHIKELFFFKELGFELRAYTLNHSTSPFFVIGFFEIGSHKLFAQDGFKPQSS